MTTGTAMIVMLVEKKNQNNHVASVLPLKDLLLCKFLHAVINTLGLAFTRLVLQATRCHSPDNYFRKPCTTECDWQMQHCCNCLKHTARERERAGKREREEQGVNAALSNERETKEEVLQKSCHSLQQRWTLTGVRSDVFAECHFWSHLALLADVHGNRR